MMLPIEKYFVLGKMQMYSFNIFTEKYNNYLPIKITQNRPAGTLKNILHMMKNGEDYQTILNYYGDYFLR